MADRPPLHVPVLYNVVLSALRPAPGCRLVDGTLGAGAPDGELLGLDRDPAALRIAAERLKPFGQRVLLRQASFAEVSAAIEAVGWSQVDGVLLDLGMSSMQLDDPQRGFSFQQDGPLDMRFDPSASETAADLVNNLQAGELADLLARFGEEPRARRVAQANDELETVVQGLGQAMGCLRPGGRLAVISFHSLEDRAVKQFMRRESTTCLCPPRQPACTCGHSASLKEITRSPIRPEDDEVRHNPRARSARLRVAERLGMA
jgi:16S rRNA (cytosine1402-N4)-methyltransferase